VTFEFGAAAAHNPAIARLRIEWRHARLSLDDQLQQHVGSDHCVVDEQLFLRLRHRHG
jgi:hypothetical protein